MNIKELKRKQSKIIGIIVTLMLLVMSVPINKSVAVDTENTANTANTASVAELETTASADGTIEVTKIWDDEENAANRPQSVTYKLYKKSDRTNPVKTLTLNSTTNKIDDYTWQGKFENIPQKENDEDITYIVTEENVANYISIADKTATTTSVSEVDTNVGIKFKFNEQTNIAKVGTYYLPMFQQNDGLKIYAHDTKNDTWYKIKEVGYGEEYIFADNKIRETLYDINIERDMEIINQENVKIIDYVDTGSENHLVGYDYPESKHPVAIGDQTTWIYKASPKSSIEWYVYLDLQSWGGGWGLKIDKIETTGNHNYFVSSYNRQNIPFKKVFEDEGFEDLRKDSEFYLFGNNEKIDTITLNTATNKGQNEWTGTFENVPIYDANWKKIEYRIEEKKSDNYTTYYDTIDYQGLAIKFSTDSYLESGSIGFGVHYKNEEGQECTANHFCNDWADRDNTAAAITDATIYIPAKEFWIEVDWNENSSNNYARIKIDSIKPVANVDRGIKTGNSGIPIKEMYSHTGKDYLDFDNTKDKGVQYNGWDTSRRRIVWKYKYSDTQSFGTNKIINKINKAEVKKVWNDNGSKSTRPQSIKIDISNVDNPDAIVKTIELTADDEDEQDGNVWKKVITGLPEYDENGYKINYIYKEQEQDNYKTTYESSKKLTGYEVTMEDGTNMSDFGYDVYVKSYMLTVPPEGGYQAGNQYYYPINIWGYTTVSGPDGLTYKFIIPIKSDSSLYDKNGPKFAFYVSQSALNKSFKIKAIRPVYEDEYVVNEDTFSNTGSEQVTKSTLEVAKKFSQTADIALDKERI